MFESIHDLLTAAATSQQPLVDVILQDEMESTNASREQIIARMRKTMTVMQQALHEALQHPRDLA